MRAARAGHATEESPQRAGEAGPEKESEAAHAPSVAEGEKAPSVAENEKGRDAGRQAVDPVPRVSETGETEEVEVYGQTLRLQGRTRASFSHSFRTVNVVTEPGTGCDGCRERDCVHVTGTLQSTYSVTTNVTLPSVPAGLTPCQRARVQDALTNILGPHEQQHVAAFNTYNGATSTPFDMTVCRASFSASVRAMHDAEASARQASAQALSDALDPFFFDVDLDCDEQAANEPAHTTAGAQNPDEADSQQPDQMA